MIPLPSYALHEVAAWIRRWQPEREVVADTAHAQIVVADSTSVLRFDTDAVQRLVPARTGASS
jgi:hypothetical protein